MYFTVTKTSTPWPKDCLFGPSTDFNIVQTEYSSRRVSLELSVGSKTSIRSFVHTKLTPWCEFECEQLFVSTCNPLETHL